MKRNSAIYIVLLVLAVTALALVIFLQTGVAEENPVIAGPEPETISLPEPEPQLEPLDQPEAAAELEDDGLPHDKLFITVERQNYQDQQLTLRIPKLDKVEPVYNGTSAETLKKGVGLYEYAQLPGMGNRNVSLAGHRNTSRGGIITDNAPFYYIDTLESGDYLYLTDVEQIYRYLYEDTKVVEADDWGPIYSQGFPCLTITSCEPIGVATHRIIVRGRLVEIFPFSEDFSYLAAAESELEE